MTRCSCEQSDQTMWYDFNHISGIRWRWKMLKSNLCQIIGRDELGFEILLCSKYFCLSFQLLLVHGLVWSSEGWVGDIQCGCWGCCQHRRLPGWLPRWPVSGDSSCLCSPLYKYLNTDRLVTFLVRMVISQVFGHSVLDLFILDVCLVALDL